MIKEAERHRPEEQHPGSKDPVRDFIDIVIETPKGSHAKYKLDDEHGFFKLDKILPAGSVFPYGFGFFPGTRAEDGDPLDVLMLSDVVGFPGCVIASRLLGVLEAEQTEKDGSTVRNDRIIAAAAVDPLYRQVDSLSALDKALVDDIAHFFASYNEARGVRFRPLGTQSSAAAYALVAKSRTEQEKWCCQSKKVA
jgi:inorganic pyrophosphatase